MNSTLITILFLVVFLGCIFTLVYALPILFVKIRANRVGWNVTWSEAKILKSHNCVKNDFLENAKEIEDVSIEKLCHYYLASGNMKDLKKGIVKLREMKISFELDTLFTILLARKNLDEVISNIGSDRRLDLVKSLTE